MVRYLGPGSLIWVIPAGTARGRGFSATDRTRLFTHSASGSLAADFNENGWVDLAIGYHRVESEHKAYSAVWWNGPDGFDEKNVTLLPIEGPHGISSVDPGSLVDRGPDEYYSSAPFELPDGSSVASISWETETPPKSWVRAQLRFADTQDGLETAMWERPNGSDNWVRKRATCAWRAASEVGPVQAGPGVHQQSEHPTPDQGRRPLRDGQVRPLRAGRSDSCLLEAQHYSE